MSGTAEAKRENDRGTVLMMGVVMGTVRPVRGTTASALASLSCRYCRDSGNKPTHVQKTSNG